MTSYYNEIDPYAAQWLRNLINAGHIAPGIVDERSIEDVFPSDLRGFAQCHFFAGIGVWSYALRSAGWSDDRPVWTGSCPCQPFSAAGKGAGFDDQRHLWPHWHHLIKECEPAAVFGEQVASRDADAWIDLVSDDLEELGYAVGAVPFPSAGVGAPHIRDRLYWVAHADGLRQPRVSGRGQVRTAERGEAGRLGHAAGERQGAQRIALGGSQSESDRGGAVGGLADADGRHPSAEGLQRGGEHGQQPQDGGALQHSRPRPTNGLWRDADWLLCRDGRWRPVEPGTFPLAHGVAGRVGRLRAYGNAICAEAARVFIEAAMTTPSPSGKRKST